MIWIGLTGGIGSGKSEVTGRLRELGYDVIDADALARQAITKNSSGYQKVIQTFGQVTDSTGQIDRKRLANIVFNDRKKLHQLEMITHPLVKILCTAEKERLESLGKRLAFYDVPLLFEKNLTNQFDFTIVVYCLQTQQYERLRLRNQFSENNIAIRIAAQIDIELKKSQADLVIDNSGPLANLDRQIDSMLTHLPSKN